MKNFFSHIDHFFFAPISATGFGLMRMLWGAVTFTYLVQGLPDVTRYYSAFGVIPAHLYDTAFRDSYRFTLLQTFNDPQAVHYLYYLFILTSFCTMIGLWPRLSTIVSTLLMFSFHEANLLPLGGGDTVLRTLGFLLVIAPEIRAFSVERLPDQFTHWQKNRTLLPTLTQPIWPYRLLLWQMIILYITSGFDKLLGTMWKAGTAVAPIMHHPHFFRWSKGWMDFFGMFSPLMAHYTLLWEFSWLLLLIPSGIRSRLQLKIFEGWSLKRCILFGGVLFHGGIYLLMDVGTFCLAIACAYVGLLVQEDFDTFRRMMNRGCSGAIAVFYDSHCMLCKRSMCTLQILDCLGRLQPVDFRKATEKKKYASDIKLADLDRAMHVRFPDGRTVSGFDAFRALSPHIPALWILIPFLWIPGVAPIGRTVYAWIAARRDRCAGGVCRH